MIKLLIGGSPCTYWSIAQKNNRETKAEGLGWELFKNYLIAKEKFKPDFFLYENNKSAAQPIKEQISHELGVDLMYINSALVSAQNRQRFYAFNWEVEQPEDRGILLKDILENGIGFRNDKAYTIDASYYKGGNLTGFNRQSGKRLQVAEPVRVGALPRPNGELSTSQGMRVYSDDGKSVTLNANGGGMGAKTGLYAIRTNVSQNDKRYCNDKNMEHLMRPYGSKAKICSVETEKSPTLLAAMGTGGGNGIYLAENIEKENKFVKIYKVKDGLITIKEKQYPIKLADGYYIIRKLTPIECERLQTMPDNYTAGVSNSQRYKGLGNGWTAEVIIHILNGALKDIPKDEEIVVLSMYDGIGTGRYCLDKMGFTNVKYYAYEIDKYAKQIAMNNYPDIIQMGDAFDLRHPDWTIGY